ncbi:MAG: ACT domain-containing protein, partial [Alphaproteobacteria bacterium]|nr:ACT domain-containing protein [Alphaproteobacteria bacterium]
VEMAMKYNMPVQVLSTFENAIGSDLMGTLVVKETNMESKVVTGITYTRDAAKITLIGVPDKIGIAAAIFTPLAAANINVDMIIQTAATPQGRTDLTFTVGKQDLERAVKVIEENADKIQYTEITCLKDVSKVSLIGIGMRSNQGVAASMFRTLAEKGINIIVIETSEITISVLIKDEYTELAVRALHAAYGLEN